MNRRELSSHTIHTLLQTLPQLKDGKQPPSQPAPPVFSSAFLHDVNFPKQTALGAGGAGAGNEGTGGKHRAVPRGSPRPTGGQSSPRACRSPRRGSLDRRIPGSMDPWIPGPRRADTARPGAPRPGPARPSRGALRRCPGPEGTTKAFPPRTPGPARTGSRRWRGGAAGLIPPGRGRCDGHRRPAGGEGGEPARRRSRIAARAEIGRAHV